MPPNQASPSSSIYESSFVDYGDIYVEILEECRPFYSLATADKHLNCQKTIQPRLEDALKNKETPEKKWKATVDERQRKYPGK